VWYNKTVKALTLLAAGLYIFGSLSCGVGAKINCCAKKQDNPAAQLCHSSSQASKKSPTSSNSFDLCCCSVSAALPKSLENLKSQVGLFSFLPFYVSFVRGSDFKVIFSTSSLSPPDEFYKRHFFQLVYPSHAPPLTA